MKYLIIILLALTLLFAGCTLFKEPVDPNDPCSALEGGQKDYCYMEAGTCSKVKSEVVRDTCVVELAKKSQSLDACKLVKDETTQGFCQSEIAILKNNPDACDDIENVYWHDNCYNKFALEEEKGQFCGEIFNDLQYMECYMDVALKTNKAGLCFILNNPDKDICFNKIAQATKDVETCKKIKNLLNAEVCIAKVAKLKGDMTICDQLTFKELRITCREKITG
ncbi:hypothetical protein HQ489_00385 [Candidatus Woesearchaeota archaeon]|nr:hypothetical protein [Candidatus Woesearchaeota archaeon]